MLVHQGFFLRMAAEHPISFNLGTLQHFPFLRRIFIIQMFNYHSAGKWDLIAIFRIFFAVKKTGKTINSFLVTFLRLPLSCTWIVRILCLNVWKLFFFEKKCHNYIPSRKKLLHAEKYSKHTNLFHFILSSIQNRGIIQNLPIHKTFLLKKDQSLNEGIFVVSLFWEFCRIVWEENDVNYESR